MAAPSTTRAGAEARLPVAKHDHNAYHRGACRCPVCTEAWRLYSKRYREGRLEPSYVDATGTRRRVRGLMALGWTRQHIAESAGLHVETINALATGRSAVTFASTNRAIREVADRLGSKRCPSGITRSRAERAGYLPLLAWDEDTIGDPLAEPHIGGELDAPPDEVAIMRAIHAARADLPLTPLTPAELAVVIPRLAAAPYFRTDTQLRHRFRLGSHTVQKLRAAAGVPPSTRQRSAAAA